jgi:hypothetical protein
MMKNKTMEELYRIKEEIYQSQKGMTLEERFDDLDRRGEEAIKRLGLADSDSLPEERAHKAKAV